MVPSASPRYVHCITVISSLSFIYHHHDLHPHPHRSLFILHLYNHYSTYLSIRPIYLSIHLSINLSIHPIYLSIYQSIPPPFSQSQHRKFTIEHLLKPNKVSLLQLPLAVRPRHCFDFLVPCSGVNSLGVQATVLLHLNTQGRLS